MAKYTDITVEDLLALPDTEFIITMTPTVHSWVNSMIADATLQDLRKEAFNVCMTEVCSRRGKFDSSKNKTFIPWAAIYARAEIKKLIRFNRDIVRLPETTEISHKKKGKARTNYADPLYNEEGEPVDIVDNRYTANADIESERRVVAESLLQILEDENWLLQLFTHAQVRYINKRIVEGKPLLGTHRRKIEKVIGSYRDRLDSTDINL